MSKYTYQEVKNYIENESNSNCKLISNENAYKNVKEKITILCHCGNEFKTTFEKFKYRNKRQCNSCSKASAITKLKEYYANDNFKKPKKVTNNIKIKSIKINAKNNIDKRKTNLRNISLRKNNEQFRKEVYNLLGDEYTILSEYITRKIKVLIRHNICHHEYYVTPYNLLHGTKCPLCSKKKRNKHYKWRNGITSIYKYLRQEIESWKIKIFKYYDNKCVISGSTQSVYVHHLINFYTILYNILDKFDLERKNIGAYSEEELNIIKNNFLDEHTIYIGVCVHKKLHRLFHKLYGRFNNTPEQFDEFKHRCKLGEFYDFFKENNLNLVI